LMASMRAGSLPIAAIWIAATLFRGVDLAVHSMRLAHAVGGGDSSGAAQPTHSHVGGGGDVALQSC